MAGKISAFEFAEITLESSGGSLANNNQVAATNTLDNRSGGTSGGAGVGDVFLCNFELNTGFGSGPTVGNIVNLYLVPALDGTNYADVDTSGHVMPPACFVGSFIINKSATAAQRMVILGVPINPLLYKAYIDNQSGQSMSTTWTLKAVSSEVQYT